MKRRGASLRNLRFGTADGRRKERLIADAGEQNGYQVSLGTFDRPHTELRMLHDIGDPKSARNGQLVDSAPCVLTKAMEGGRAKSFHDALVRAGASARIA